MESWKDAVPKWFPIAAAALAFLVGGAQAKSALDEHGRRIQAIEQIVPEVRERLARMEGKLDSLQPKSAAIHD